MAKRMKKHDCPDLPGPGRRAGNEQPGQPAEDRLAGLGSEHGEDTVLAGAVQAAKAGIDVYYIGTQEHAGVTTVPAADADECHRVMEDLLDRHDVDVL